MAYNPQAASTFSYAGNPNGAVAGNTGVAGTVPPDFVWDTTHKQYWICTTTGSTSTAVWQVAGSIAPVTVASAGTVDLGTLASTSATITGNTPMSSFGSSAPAGVVYTVIFSNVVALNYNATSMILPGFANVNTTAGDNAQFLSLGSGNWRCINYLRASQPIFPSSMQANFKNLKITVASASYVTVTADSLTLTDGNGNYMTITGFSQTINPAVNAAGGLDVGSLGGNLWYYVWAGCTATGVPTAYISLSSTSPTKPAGGFTFAARVGAVRASATAVLLWTIQYGRRARYVVGGSGVANLPIMASGALGNISTPTWIALAVSGFSPPTASSINITVVSGSSGTVMVGPNNSYGASTSMTNPPFLQSGITAGASEGVSINADIVLESTNIYAAIYTAGAVACGGWEDNI